ncbi:MAG: hypothetical protein K5931_05805, partial [Lachnospiraceae bacterium]|nr:hypothetical protein [Lachnospiraceae bacterium]
MKKKTVIIILVIVLLILLGSLALLILGSAQGEEEEFSGSDRGSEQSYSKEYETKTVKDHGKYQDRISEELAKEPGEEESWTIMVYMCGTDLESDTYAATSNIAEMLNADLSDNVNLLIQTGGTKEWDINNYDDWFASDDHIESDKLGFFSVRDNVLNFEKNEALRSMGEASTLRDFIIWAGETYPADNNMLIFWDHGGGAAGGVCYDELFDDDSLDIKEIREAVEEADLPLELVGFDACLMANLDTAEALQGYGHYMVASEEIEPGSGWMYEDFLSFLSQDTSMDGLTLGARIADGFMEKCKEDQVDDLVTLSVTDLTKIPALSAAYRDFSGEMLYSTEEPERFRSVCSSIMKAENYGGNNDYEGYSDMVDLEDMVEKTEDLLNWNAENVKETLEDAVKYKVNGKNRKKSGGLSVFYPLSTDEEELQENYMKVSDNPAILEYVTILSEDWNPEEWNKSWEEKPLKLEVKEGRYDSYFNKGQKIEHRYEENPENQEIYQAVENLSPVKSEDYKLEYDQYVDSDSHLHLNIKSGLEIVQEARYELFYVDQEDNCLIYMGSDNYITGDIDKGEIIDDFRGTWLAIGGELICASLIQQDEEYNLYSIPITLNGEEMFLRAEYDYGEESYNIIGAVGGIGEDGQPSREVKSLKPGDKLEFLFYTVNENMESQDYTVIGDGIIWDEDTEMMDMDLP